MCPLHHANTIEPSVSGGDAALCQITCYFELEELHAELHQLFTLVCFLNSHILGLGSTHLLSALGLSAESFHVPLVSYVALFAGTCEASRFDSISNRTSDSGFGL